MQPKITLRRLDKTGDTEDFLVRVVGPGETDYTFKLSVTGTIDAIWGSDTETAAKSLVNALIYSHGTARAYPEAYWFDSNNSGETVKATVDLIYNEGEKPFLHPAIRGKYVQFIGDETFGKIEAVDAQCKSKVGQPFFSSLDDAFEYTEAADDLSKPPRDNANLLYRVCVLSVIIDHLSVGVPGSETKGSLNRFDEWQEKTLASMLVAEVEVFRMLKRLRKQYPIHEHYKLSPEGVRSLRNDVVAATAFFELRKGEPEYNWHQVLKRFNDALDGILKALQ